MGNGRALYLDKSWIPFVVQDVIDYHSDRRALELHLFVSILRLIYI